MTLDACADGPGANHSLHEELSGEAQHDSIECHKRNVVFSLSIHVRSPWVVRSQWIGEEDGMVQRVLRPRLSEIACEDNEDEDERVKPGVS